MASQRITRERFDAVVQEKMKRFRMTMDQAVNDTVRECQLDAGPSMKSMGNYDSLSRDQGRRSFRDPLDRGFAMDVRRDAISNSAYFRESGGRLSDSLLEKLSSADPLLKERLYRQELLARDLHLGSRNWDLESKGVPGSEHFRGFRNPQGTELGPGKNVFSPQGKGRGKMQSPRGKGPGNLGGGAARNAGKAHNKQHDAKTEKVSAEDDRFCAPIVKWAKFYQMKNDPDFLAQHKALFKTDTEACITALNCFKGHFPQAYTDLCFNSLKPLSHPAFKSPKIDNDLLDLLIETKTVPTKNDFFLAIKPYDKQLMQIQQRLLNVATPLLLACNTFELKDGILVDPKQLFPALKNTVFLCRKSLVLLGQTFALATTVRQTNVMEVLGLSGTGMNPSECPNFKDSFLFGKQFITKLKDWLKKSGQKLTLKSSIQPTVPKDAVKEGQSECVAECKDATPVDSETMKKIEQLVEYAKHGMGEKPPFWFLFDKNSREYAYYRHKFREFQKSTGLLHTKFSQTQRFSKKLAPEEPNAESLRAMLYARKAQAVKKKISRSLASLRKRKLTKAKDRCSKVLKDSVKLGNETHEVKEATKPTRKVPKEQAACKEEVVKEPKKNSTVTASEPAKVETSSAKKESSSEQQESKLGSAEPQEAEVDDKTKDTAIKLADFVVQMGPEIEEFSMQNSVNNPDFWFLREKNSPAYRFYRSKVEEFKRVEQEAASDVDYRLVEEEDEEDDLENIRTGDEEMDACEAAEAPGAVAAFSQMPTPARPPIARKRVAKLKVGMLPAKRVCLVDEPKVHDPVRIEYERPGGRGVNRKKKPVDLEFANKKLTGQNVGFKMLSKMGWQEGQGLGSCGSGIVNPIKVGSVSGGEGLGAESKAPAKSTDDNFDAFRQRMMQMYKQKIGK